MDINCSPEFPPVLWLNGSNGSLHTDTHMHILQNNYPWTQFNTNSTLSSSLFPLKNQHTCTHTRTHAHGDGRAQTQNRSLSLLLQKAWTPTGKRPRLKRWKAWIIWAKVNWSHPAVLFLEKAASYTKDGREQIGLCVGAPVSARIPHVCVYVACACDDDVAAAVNCGCKLPFLPLSISYSCINCPRNTRLTIYLWKHMCVGVCSLYVSACICLHVCKCYSYHIIVSLRSPGLAAVPFFINCWRSCI